MELTPSMPGLQKTSGSQEHTCCCLPGRSAVCLRLKSKFTNSMTTTGPGGKVVSESAIKKCVLVPRDLFSGSSEFLKEKKSGEVICLSALFNSSCSLRSIIFHFPTFFWRRTSRPVAIQRLCPCSAFWNFSMKLKSDVYLTPECCPNEISVFSSLSSSPPLSLSCPLGRKDKCGGWLDLSWQTPA